MNSKLWGRLTLLLVFVLSGCIEPPAFEDGTSRDTGNVSDMSTTDTSNNGGGTDVDAAEDLSQGKDANTANDASVDASPDTSCTDSCPKAGMGKCETATKFYKCGTGDDGCLEWKPEETCEDGESCDDVTGCSCANDCTSGESTCMGGDYYECVESSGCFEFQHSQDCKEPQSCNPNTGCECPVDCTANDTSCDAGESGGVYTCQDQGVCNNWNLSFPCGPRQKCYNGSCVCTAPSCTVGETRCDAGTFEVQKCVKDGNGCTYWTRQMRCPDHQYCSDAGDEPTCVNCQYTCSSGDQRCATVNGAMRVQNCVQTIGDVCPSWSSPLGCGTDDDCCDTSNNCSTSDGCATCGDYLYCTK